MVTTCNNEPCQSLPPSAEADPNLWVPVVDEMQFSYMNAHCARCNNATISSVWEVTVYYEANQTEDFNNQTLNDTITSPQELVEVTQAKSVQFAFHHPNQSL